MRVAAIDEMPKISLALWCRVDHVMRIVKCDDVIFWICAPMYARTKTGRSDDHKANVV